jgi:hypothetical protein
VSLEDQLKALNVRVVDQQVEVGLAKQGMRQSTRALPLAVSDSFAVQGLEQRNHSFKCGKLFAQHIHI